MNGLFDTLQLSSSWDLTLDASRNIAVQRGSAAIAQDVASAARTFQGEVWYDTTLGIPYFDTVLGQRPAYTLLAAYYSQAAFTVPNVVQAQVTFNQLGAGRVLTGTLEVIDTYGQSINASF